MSEQKQKAVPVEQHATEFLANERTFLAWIRTSIAVISLGFAVTKFDAWLNEIAENTATNKFNGSGWSIPMGLAMIIFAGLLPVFAAWRYHAVNSQIERGAVSADRGLIVLVTLLIVALATVFILYLLESGGNL